MIVHQLRDVVAQRFGAPIAIVLGLAIWSLAPPPAEALNNKQQLLHAVSNMTAGQTAFLSPGAALQFAPDFPGTGLGEAASQLRMSGGGVLSLLWFRVTTENVPSSGGMTATVRINGADTALTCTVLGTGQCQTGATTVNIANGARLTVRISNNFVGSGNIGYNYTMLLD